MTEAIEATRAWFAVFFAVHAVETPRDAVCMELKRRHCEQVMAEARQLALALDLAPHLVSLATIAGLCHDVGRFPQYQQYKTFSDAQSVNHGLLGARALTRHGGLAGLAPRDRALVRLAVVVHNRRTLPPALTFGRDPAALVLARIVRDADKIDIVRIMLDHYTNPGDKDEVVFLGLPDRPEQFNPAIIADIEAGKIGNYTHMASINDFALLLLSWINDMAFPWTRQQFFARGHVRELFAQLPDLPQLAAFETRYCERFAPKSA
ncbi:HD domain-containing protein [Solidesulfovibrio sp.]